MVAQSVVTREADCGIVICGTGTGVALAANKIRGVRAATCLTEYMAEMSRKHENANVLALGAMMVSVELAFRIVETWLRSAFEGGRHQRRVNKVCALESDHFLGVHAAKIGEAS